MLTQYLRQLKTVLIQPSEFFFNALESSDMNDASKFAALTAILVALEVGLDEFLGGGSLGMVGLVTIIMLVGLPFATLVGIYVWAGFTKVCGYLMDVNLPMGPLRLVTAYSSAGMLALGLGFTLGKWLALVIVFYQVVGMERALKCSRITAVIYVMLPLSLVGVLVGIFTLMFKVF